MGEHTLPLSQTFLLVTIGGFLEGRVEVLSVNSLLHCQKALLHLLQELLGGWREEEEERGAESCEGSECVLDLLTLACDHVISTVRGGGVVPPLLLQVGRHQSLGNTPRLLEDLQQLSLGLSRMGGVHHWLP